MLTMTHTALHKIKVHSMEAYPEECCGILLGSENKGSKEVLDVLRIDNAKGENRTRRFLITPADYRRAEAEAEAERLEVIGFYHSHPDHPAMPSQFDLDHAWPSCSYVIASVEERVPCVVRSWVLKDDRSAFEEEPLESLREDSYRRIKTASTRAIRR
ncbi:MAG TPA: M67 family metallopeptidase [Bacteroidota bacterium]|nr:M67 family metallopeptidase [Bacteroidota bacterium]